MRARTGWVACAALVAAVAWTSAIGQEPALSWPAPADGMADEEVLERALPMVQDEEQRGRRARIAALRDSLDPLLRANRGDALLRNLDEIAELQEEDGLSADLVEQTRATRDEMALRWAAVLAARAAGARMRWRCCGRHRRRRGARRRWRTRCTRCTATTTPSRRWTT